MVLFILPPKRKERFQSAISRDWQKSLEPPRPRTNGSANRRCGGRGRLQWHERPLWDAPCRSHGNSQCPSEASDENRADLGKRKKYKARPLWLAHGQFTPPSLFP